ncbi:hypothetical protein LCGC14_1020330 [marine sediment metagenome]|uniref:TIGR00725 family protein n=1 Tax=marine sediment metagenome TaxID=412755 RepID=A0A0F9QFN9_9ZZZZ|nr:TIGR00725 family protein [bacterium]
MTEKIIGVIGDANLSKDDIKWKCAFEVGKLLIDNEYRLANGGMGGVMEASILGAKSSVKYKEGMTIGVLPDYNKSSSNSKADIIIPTGLGLARNVILVSMCDAIIAIGGGSGTLSEIALAWQMNKMIIAIDFDGWSGNLKSMQLDKRRLDKIFEAENAINAVEILKNNIENYKSNYKGVKKARLGVNNAKKIIQNKFDNKGSIILLGKGAEGYVFRDETKVFKIYDNDEPLLNQYWRLIALSEDINKSIVKYLINFKVYYEENLLVITYDHFESKPYEGGYEKDLILLAKELKKIGWLITDFQPKNTLINKETELPTIIDIGHSFEPYSSHLFRKMCRRMYVSSLAGNFNNIKSALTETNSNEEFLELMKYGYNPESVKKDFNIFYEKIMILDKKDVLNPLILNIIQETADINTLFDYGSGSGDIASSIKKLGIEVIAYDPDINLYDKYRNGYYKDIKFISKDSLNNFLKSGEKFDCVLTSLVLCHPLHLDEMKRNVIIKDILNDITSLSSNYILIAICNPLYTIKSRSSLQIKTLPHNFDYFNENSIKKLIKSSNGIRYDYHRPISYYEKLFQAYNLKVLRIEQTIGENLDNPNIFYSDFLIFLLEVD